MITRQLVIGIVLLLGFQSQSLAQSTANRDTMSKVLGRAQVMTTGAFFDRILKHHPIARQAALFTENARQELRVARGAFDPKLEADFATKEFKNDRYYRNLNSVLKVPAWIGELKGGYEQNLGMQVNPEVRTPNSGLAYAGISMPLPISQGFWIDERRATLQQAKLFGQIAEAERVKEINKLLLSAAKEYWAWYFAWNEYAMIREAHQLADVRYQAVKERVAQGDLAPIDSVDAQTALQDRTVQLGQAEVVLANVRMRLSNYLWDEDEIPLEIAEGVVPAEFDTKQPILGEAILADLLQQARQQHPELRKLTGKIGQLEMEERYRRDLLKPAIRVEYNLLSAAPVPVREVDMAFLRNNYKFGASLSFPLFLRKERGKLQQTIIKLKQHTFERTQTGREIENSVRAVYNELKTTEQLLGVQQSVVENYRLLRDGEMQKFDNGESSLFLINSREAKLIEAQVKMIALRSKYEQQKAELRWAAGALNLEDLK